MQWKPLYGFIMLGLVFGAIVLGAWMLFGETQDHTARGWQGDLELSITLNKTVVLVGDSVKIVLTLKNNGNKNATFWMGPPFFDVYLYDLSDNLVAKWSEGKAFPEYIMEITLQPEETFSKTVDWNLSSYDYENGGFVPVKPGKYRVSGVWLGQPPIETAKIPVTVNEVLYTESGAVQTALEFLMNGPTFRFDGIPSSIKVEDVVIASCCPWTWNVQLSFSSAHSGYGDRTGKILLQVITPHKMWVVVQRGTVVSAVIDGIWDELNQKFLKEGCVDVIEARELVMDYIGSHHKITADLMGDIEWSGGDVTPPGLVGRTTHQYIGDGWTFTISWPVIPKPTYEVTAEYQSLTTDFWVLWRGTVNQERVVTETEFRVSCRCLKNVMYEYYGTVGLFEPRIYIISTDNDPVTLYETGDWTVLNDYWKMLKDHATTRASTRDFISILIPRGDFPTGGYEIEVTSLNFEDDKFLLSAGFTNPSEDVPVTQAFTNPTALIPIGRLPAGEYKVRLHIDLFLLIKTESGFVRVPILTFKEVVWTTTFIVVEG